MMVDGTWKRLLVGAGVVVLTLGTGPALAKAHEHAPGHGHGASSGAHGKGGEPDHPGQGKDGHAGSHGSGKGVCDPVAAADVQVAAAASCPCDGVDDGAGGLVPWKNHGQYVRCIAHAVRDLGRAAGMKRRCVRELVPCSARSACGKPGAITCLVAKSGACVDGACTNDDDLQCVVDADCTIEVCGVTTVEHCAALAGVPGSTPSCCTASASGAFLD